MSRSLLVIVLITSLLTFRCDSAMEPAVSYDAEEAIAVKEVTNATPVFAQTVDRKLIKEGFITFETNSLEETRQHVQQAINQYQAYVASEQEYKDSDRVTNTMTVRVPANYFDSLLNKVGLGIERFDRKVVEVRDVTEEFLDVQARLKTKKSLEARYLVLLQQASDVTEILEIEKQAGQLRTEIESIEGRLKYLKNQVAYSTLTITFYEEATVTTEFGQQFSNGLRNGWNNLIWVLVGIINIWPFVFLAVGIIIGWRVWKRKKQQNV